MPDKAELIVQCPSCKKPVKWAASSQFKPFCSERCRLIDLGEWASERHVIQGEELTSDVFSETAHLPLDRD